MSKKANIIRIIGMLMLALALMFALSGCSNDPASETNKSDDEMANEHLDCWQKEILTLLYDTMGTVSMGMYNKITDGAFSLMMIAFSIWFAIRMLKFVSSVKDAAGESAEMWNEVLQKFLLCFVCGYLATSVEGLLWILNMVIFPIYNAFLEFGAQVLSATSDTNASGQQTVTVFGQTVTAGKSIICTAEGARNASMTGFPEAPRNMMNCMICAVNERLTLGNALAFHVLKMPGFMVTVVGLLILFCFTIIKLGFVFYLVDTIFRFTMMIVLLPILIMSYAFEKTREWTKTGFQTIMNSAAFMMVIAILIAMALLAVIQILQDNPAIFNPQGEAQEAAFKEFNPAVMSLLLIAFLIKNTLSVAQKMVSTIVGGNAEAKFQKKLKALVGMIGKGILAWLTAGASKGIEAVQRIQKVKDQIDKAKNSHVGKAVKAAHNKYKGAKDKFNNIKDKMNNLAGR